MGFKNKLAQFMYGRYGMDALYRFLFIAALVLAFINIFAGSTLLWAAETALLIWALYRAFSRNIAGRQAENFKYLSAKNKVMQFLRRQINRVKYRKTKVYKKCPQCKANLCLPRKKGKHTVKCPTCSHRFDVKI